MTVLIVATVLVLLVIGSLLVLRRALWGADKDQGQQPEGFRW